ncbi:Fatty acid hydroxylase family (carotene hydroxylase/sterol desaturase) [hydrothermal vent metagenome]|uniref:Fatty acid hydroxylase family (Carotene hydroxylase/sterol desaturase) n=1 Tax=hydrothermal vent metagenome TaxID=652676 RepID=A0A3B0SSB9_9ZZZZ
MIFTDQTDALIRFGIFASVFLLLAGLELFSPRRPLTQSKPHRWFTNLSLIVVDTLALRVAMPIMAVGMAHIAAQKGWGLLAMVDLPIWAEFIIAMLLLDLAIYAQHVATHKIPLLWRLHKVHHVDRDFDVTTAARFHPLEIIFSMAYKLLCVALIGPSALAVFVFEIVLNASTMFNHSNLKLPLGLDRALRRLVVTPDMHRVHHSVIRKETDSNYGFFLSIWDQIFRTYIPQPKAGHDQMTIGLPTYQDDKPIKLGWSLLLPFLPNRRTGD